MWRRAMQTRQALGVVLTAFLLGHGEPVKAVDFAGGTGESNDPYQIATAEQLIGMGKDPNLYDKCFILVNDIDLSDKIFDQAVIAPGRVHYKPRGGYQFVGEEFHGVLNGNGYCIKGLSIQGSNTLGLVGGLGADSRVICLGLEFVDINGIDGHVGGLASFSSRGSISNCYITGIVCGGINIGGMVGINKGQIDSCYSEASVSGNVNVGGLVGYNTDNWYSNTGIVRMSYASGPVITPKKTNFVGGLVGANYSRNIVACFHLDPNDGGGPENNAGKALTIEQMQDRLSFSTWDFFGDPNDGPADAWFMPNGSLPVLSYETTVTQLVKVPRLSGLSVDQAQATLKKASLALDSVQLAYHPWIPIGLAIRPVSRLYERSNTAINLLVSQGPYDWSTNPGDGTEASPYQIQTEDQLTSIGYHPELFNRFFVLTADLDLTGQILNQAVIAPHVNDQSDSMQDMPFSGMFDGQGYQVRGLTILGKDYIGLFGKLNELAQIKNLELTNVSIVGRYSIGGLAGYNRGNITNCQKMGFVSGREYVGGLVGGNRDGLITASCGVGTVIGDRWHAGGLVGQNWGMVLGSYSIGTVIGGERIGGLVGGNHGSISNSFSMVSVIGIEYVGGLSGLHWSRDSIKNCFSMGSIHGIDSVGGLVGSNLEGIISTSYSTASISGTSNFGGLVGYNDDTVSASLWDTTTSELSRSAGGTGLSTAPMQDINTYLEAEWDFSDIWMICEGDYPHLQWEQVQCDGLTVGP